MRVIISSPARNNLSQILGPAICKHLIFGRDNVGLTNPRTPQSKMVLVIARFTLLVSFLLFLSGETDATFLRPCTEKWCRRLIKWNVRPLPRCCRKYLKTPSPVPPPVAPTAPVLPPKAPEAPVLPPKPPVAPVLPPKTPEAPMLPPKAPEGQVLPPKAPEAPVQPPKAPEGQVQSPIAPRSPSAPTNGTSPVAPTPKPVSPTPPRPTPSPTPCYFMGDVYGDPHVGTFDNLLYDCQGKGEFVMFSALPRGSLVQGRFEKVSSFSPLVTLTTGMVAKGDSSSPTVQISLTKNCTSPNIHLYVNGASIPNPFTGYVDPNVQVTYAPNMFTILFTNTGLIVTVKHYSRNYLDVKVRPPCWYKNQTIVGLLGTPDSNKANDWMDRSGTTIPIPVGSLNGVLGYNYCVKNWCIYNEQESLFKYKTECGFVDDFQYYFGCNQTYPGDVNLGTQSEAAKRFCRNSTACFIDGAVFGVEVANATLAVEIERNISFDKN